MIRSFLVGINEANRSWKMILSLLAANLLLSIPVTVPIFLLIVGASRGTMAANRLFADELDALWLMDVFNHQFPGMALDAAALQFGVLLVVIGVIYLSLNTLFAGGIVGVFNSSDGLFTMRKFGAESGAYFWRFLRLMLISLIFYGVAIGVYAALRWPMDKAAVQASAFKSVIYKQRAAMALLALMFAFVNMVFDYAKISTAINDRRRMFRQAFQAFRFGFRYFFGAFGLYLVIALLGLMLFLTFNSMRWSVNQSSAGRVFLALLLGQIVIAGRVWTRMVFYAAEMHFYKKLSPITPPAPVIIEPQLEFAKAERLEENPGLPDLGNEPGVV